MLGEGVHAGGRGCDDDSLDRGSCADGYCGLLKHDGGFVRGGVYVEQSTPRHSSHGDNAALHYDIVLPDKPAIMLMSMLSVSQAQK